MRISVIGAGRVGSAFFRALRRRKCDVVLVPARRKSIRARRNDDLVVLATRDDALPALVRKLARPGALSKRTAVVHVAGALGLEVLAPLREKCAGVGLAHPLLSIASAKAPPSFEGATLLVLGDPIAIARSRKLAQALGLRARSHPVDAALYHAAAALVANGSVAVAAIGAEVLVEAGVPAREARHLLGPLLGSVAHNVSVLGLPAALTGPVRRGDVATIQRHLEKLETRPQAHRLYAALVLSQVALARELGEASPRQLRAIRHLAVRAATR